MQASANREKVAYFSKPYGNQYIALFVRKGESNKYPITSLEELIQHDFSLGVRDSVDYGPQFKRMLTIPEFKARLHWIALKTNPLELAVKRMLAPCL